MPSKPKDFTLSAVKLTNPIEVKELLEKLSTEQASLKAIQEEIANHSPGELIAKGLTQAQVVGHLEADIRAAVEEHGSYQSLDDERYAVKYERKTPIYGNIPSFKKNFPKFSELCIKETIDITALKGQIKGKLIAEADLEKFKVLTYDTSYAFYVR